MRRNAIVATLIASLAAAADGHTVEGTIAVTATVAANCALATSPLAFGAYDPLVRNATADATTSTPVMVRCTAGSRPRLTILSSRTGEIASASARAHSVLIGPGGARLNYGFALEAPVVGSGIVRPTTWTLVGSVVHGQSIPDGLYGDELTAAVDF